MPKVKVVFDQLLYCFVVPPRVLFVALPIWQDLHENDVNLIKFPIEQTPPPLEQIRWRGGSNFQDGSQIIAKLRHASDFSVRPSFPH